MKKRILFLAMLLLLFVPTAVYANEEIGVTIGGVPVDFDGQPPVIMDGRTLVPVRGVFEMLGFEVAWDSVTSQVTLTSDNYTVVITIGSEIFTTNGTVYALDVPAQLIGGRTMVPIRLPLESVGFNLGWDNATRTVIISSDSMLELIPTQESFAQEFGLVRRVLLDGAIELYIPESFRRMTEQEIRIRYPHGVPPTLIYTTHYWHVNLAFNHTDISTTMDNLPEVFIDLENSLIAAFPTAYWLYAGFEIINGTEFGVFEIITPAIDTEIYNLMWFTVVDGRVMMVSFNATMDFFYDWFEIGNYILDTFNVIR